MSQSEVITALPIGADADSALLRNYLIKRTIYPLADTEDPEAFEALDADTGAIPRGIAWGGIIFWLDTDDTTTAHDGVTTLVTADGYRYKYDGVDFLIRSVFDKDLTAPPGSEAYGDAYLIPAGATGAWAGQTDKLAIFTSRGWKFILAKVGQIVHVEDEDSYYHYDTNGDWVGGFGDTIISSNIVRPANLLGGRPVWIVEDQTTNAPPGSPTTGVQYIIGSSPTGDWAGNAGKLAIYNGLSWTIVTPTEGYQAYDKSTNKKYTYSGSAWIVEQSGLTLILAQTISGAVSVVDFTGLDSTYFHYVCRFENVQVTLAADLLLRLGTGAGPTYQTTLYTYAMNRADETAAVSGLGGEAQTSFVLTALAIQTGSTDMCSGTLEFGIPSDSLRLGCRWNSIVYKDTNDDIDYVTGGGVREGAGPYTAIRFFPSAGSIDNGQFSLYGMAKQ